MAELKMLGLTKFIYTAFALWIAIFVVISSFGSNAVFQHRTYLVKAEPLSENWYFCYFID